MFIRHFFGENIFVDHERLTPGEKGCLIFGAVTDGDSLQTSET
jgi:hypothetical protein